MPKHEKRPPTFLVFADTNSDYPFIDGANALADIINATAATFAYDNYELFQKWFIECSEKGEEPFVTKEMLMAAVARVIARSPEHI